MVNCYYSKYEPIFGAWHITDELGSGAEGHLYRIQREDALGHVFYSALKAISVPANGEIELESMMVGGLSREEAEAYFRDVLENTTQEFELLEKLKGNSNIVSYEDHEIFEKEDGFGWDILIRMEEVTPLLKHSIYNNMDEAEILRLGKDICTGLELCQRFGIVHRDIKPENIFVSPSGSYKLGDFGIARIIEKTAASLSRKGTFSFMAPEVYWGKEYGKTVDLYSLGLVMYKFLNDGRMPFMPYYPEPLGYRDGESAFTKRVGGAKIPEPRNGSEAINSVILKACEFDPKDRYRSAGEMLEALTLAEENAGEQKAGNKNHERRADAGNKGSADKAHAVKDSGKKSKKGKIAAALVVLFLIAGGIVYAMIPKAVTDIEAEGLSDGMQIYIDESVEPVYAVKPDWFEDEPITFETSDADVIAVDENGRLQAGVPGKATVTMTAKEYSEEHEIQVVPKVTSIEGIKAKIELTTGDKHTLKPKLLPEKFSSEPVSFKVKNKKIATVSKKGVITAVAAGETAVTISAGGSKFKSTIKVSDPVIYTPPAVSSSGSYSNNTQPAKKSSGKASKGYFDSGDDEHF